MTTEEKKLRMNRLDSAEAFGHAYGVVEEGDHLRTLPWPIDQSRRPYTNTSKRASGAYGHSASSKGIRMTEIVDE
jgi:hypothetical protein